MITIFDFLTVACFMILVGAFFLFTSRETRVLLNFLVCAVAFAVANQLGNAGSTILGITLIIAGIGYALMVCRANKA